MALRNPFKRKPKLVHGCLYGVMGSNYDLQGVAFTTRQQAQAHADRCGESYSVVLVDIVRYGR